MRKGIIVDIDRADSAAAARLFSERVPGVWGAKCRTKIHKSGYEVVGKLAKRVNLFADTKIYDVEGGVVEMVKYYAGQGPYAPAFLTVSGDLPEYVIAAAVRH